jgi:hypothetical protein
LNPYGAFWIKPVVTTSYRKESPFFLENISEFFSESERVYVYSRKLLVNPTP